MTNGSANAAKGEGVSETQLRDGLEQNPGRAIGAEDNVPTASVAIVARDAARNPRRD